MNALLGLGCIFFSVRVTGIVTVLFSLLPHICLVKIIYMLRSITWEQFRLFLVVLVIVYYVIWFVVFKRKSLQTPVRKAAQGSAPFVALAETADAQVETLQEQPAPSASATQASAPDKHAQDPDFTTR